MPRRADRTHLVYLGSRLAMGFQPEGKNLQINLPIDHERLTDCFVIFGHLLGRSNDPPKSITEEPISGENAAYSQILEVFRKRFDNIVEAPKVIAYRPMDRL